jgi:hypothetical protein
MPSYTGQRAGTRRSSTVFKVVKWQWNHRMVAAGARVPPPSAGKYFRMNILAVVRLAPGFTRGRAAGIDMWFTLETTITTCDS